MLKQFQMNGKEMINEDVEVNFRMYDEKGKSFAINTSNVPDDFGAVS